MSGKSFGFPTKSTDDVERTASHHPSSECQGFGGVEEGHRAGSDVYENVKKGLHPDPDPIVNCARFGNMEPPGFVRV